MEYDERIARAGGAGVPEALPRFHLQHVQRISGRASLGGAGAHPPEEHRPRDVRELPLLRGLHQGLRPPPRRGAAAATSHSVHKILAQTVPDAARPSRPGDGGISGACCARSTPACSMSGSGCVTRRTCPGDGRSDLRPPRPRRHAMSRGTRSRSPPSSARAFSHFCAWSSVRTGSAGPPRSVGRRDRRRVDGRAAAGRD